MITQQYKTGNRKANGKKERNQQMKACWVEFMEIKFCL